MPGPAALEPLRTGIRWEDLRLPGSSRAALAALAGRRGRGTLALFSGPRSRGKSVAAEALATRLGVAAYRVDLARLVSQYIGETETNLDGVFAAAGGAPAVLFLDEADALIGRRSGVHDAHDRYANQEIAHLLQRIDAFDGIAILATNLRQAVAPAIVARAAATVGIPRLRG